MKIVQAPNQVLSTVAARINKIDKSTKDFLAVMEKTLTSASDPEGVGLAAPQVGKSLQIFIIKPTPDSKIQTFINPVIEEFFDTSVGKKEKVYQSANTAKVKKKAKIDKGVQLEGCLSLQDIWGVVKRHYGVVLSYQDETGKKHKESFDGFLSVIIQHEYDHLQGILFPKRVLEQKTKLYKSSKNKKGETEFEELSI